MSSEPMMIKYLHDKAANEGIPLSGTFELTQRCNFNCEMCYVHDANKKDDPISAEQWIDMGRQAKEAGTVFLLLTGGEPMIRKDFEEIYLGLMKMGFIITINTNGSLIDRHIEMFKKYPPFRFNISLYGADDRAYNSLCHVNSYDKVISNIKLAKENGIPVRLNHVVTPANNCDCKKIIDTAKDLDALIKSTAYAYPAIRLGKTDNEARLTAEEAAQRTIDIDKYNYNKEEFLRRYEHMINLAPSIEDNSMRCRGGRCSFWITADGIMRPCGMISEPDTYPFRDGLVKAWEQTKRNTNEIKLPDECITCKYSGFCIVCAAMCKAETGSFSKKPEYICKMMKKYYELSLREVESAKNEDKENDD